MERLFLVCVLLTSAQVFGNTEWQLWKRRFSKSYDSLLEEVAAKERWMKNLHIVEQHNNHPGAKFRLGLNSFSDQPPANRTKFTVPYVWENSVFDGRPNLRVPADFDWRRKGVVPPVPTLGQMGDALAVTAADAVASFTAIHKGVLYNLSSTEVNKCCSSHMLGPVFECIHRMGGLCKAGEFKTGPCRNPPCKQVGQVSGGRPVKMGDETALQTAVLKTPVMVGIDAGHTSFQLYRSGIYSDPDCSTTQLDHVMLVVGYGVDKAGDQYWILQNCWGKDWGMNGYVLLARNKGNMCGVASAARYPV